MKKILTSIVALSALALSFQATSETIHSAAYHGNEAKVVELLKQKPNPDARDSFGGTALHAAMFQNNIRIVEMLITAGFDVNAIGPSNGYTPAHDAVWGNNLPALKILVKHGADLSIKGKDGSTPLSKAIDEQKTEIVTYLQGVK